MTILKKYEYYFYVYIIFNILTYIYQIYLLSLKKKKGLHKIKIRAYSSLVAVDFKMRF